MVTTPVRGRRRHHQPGLAQSEPDNASEHDRFRTSWRLASLARGWRLSSDWWVPAIEPVLDAALASEDLERPCAGLGGARAAAGVGLREAFDDLWAFFSVLPGDASADVTRSFAETYVELLPSTRFDTESVHPLTGLATRAYLRGRLAEVYAEAAATGTPVRERHGLLVVQLDDTAPGWRTVARRLALGRTLRTAFDAGETVAGLGASTAVVLTRPDHTTHPPGLADTLRTATGAEVLVRSVRPPLTLPGAHLLLDTLHRPDDPR